MAEVMEVAVEPKVCEGWDCGRSFLRVRGSAAALCAECRARELEAQTAPIPPAAASWSAQRAPSAQRIGRMLRLASRTARVA